MAKYNILLFDLDGTLTDPKVGITKAVQYALSKLGIIENDLDKLEVFIGPPLLDSFKEYYSFDDAKSKEAILYYREYFSTKGIFENEIYVGIESMLKELKAINKKLIVATSKPTEFAVRILKHFNIYDYFDMVVGSNFDGTRTSKEEVIEYILDNIPNLKKEDLVMIGDRKYDVYGAREKGIDSIGVAYGYGSFDELKEADPLYIFDSVNKLKSFLAK